MVESIKHVVLKTVVCIAVLLTLGVTYSAPAQTNNPLALQMLTWKVPGSSARLLSTIT
jgi:hypothetical protein